MKYVLKGNLSANLSPTFKEPIGNVKLRCYRIGNNHKIAEIKPKHAFAIVSEEMIGKNKPFLIAEAMTDPKGNFTLEMDEGQSYNGGPLKIDVYLKKVPGQKIEAEIIAPIQFTISKLQPQWRKTRAGYSAYLHPRLAARYWCFVRRLLDAWTISGRVIDSATNTPFSGVTVFAFDADQRNEYDNLGKGTTNARGRFRIDYSSKNFVDLSSLEGLEGNVFSPFISAGPDLFFLVTTPGGAPLLKESSKRGHMPDRENAGPCFCVDLTLNETGKLYVAGDSDVSVVDIESNTVVDTIAVGGTPEQVAFTPDGSFAYVANRDLNNVSVINTATRTVVDSVAVGGPSNSLVMAPDGTKCYVGGENTLWVIDPASNSVSATIPIDPDIYDSGSVLDLEITPDGGKVYASLFPYGGILIIDSATNTIVNNIGWWEITELRLSPDGTRLYVVDQVGADISVIDTATDEIIATIHTDDEVLYGMGITPDGARIYTGGFYNISVVDIATEAVIATLPYGNCYDIEFTPGGTRAYVQCGRGTRDLLVFDTAANTLIATLSGIYGDITIAPNL